MKRLIGISTLALSLLAGSLASTAAFAQPEQPAPQQQQQRHAHKRHGGGGMYGQALKLGSLTSNQRQAIEQIQVALKAPRQAAKLARTQYAEAVAMQVQAGAVNLTALQLKAAQVVTAATAESIAERGGIAQLHSVLDASQRAELVNGIEAKMDQRGQAGAKHRARGRGESAKLAKQLGLSDTQKQEVRDVLKAERKAHQNPQGASQAKGQRMVQRKQNLESFKGDTFTPSGDPTTAASRAREHVVVYTETVQKILPILTAEQRGVFAQKIQARAGHGRMAL